MLTTTHLLFLSAASRGDPVLQDMLAGVTKELPWLEEAARDAFTQTVASQHHASDFQQEIESYVRNIIPDVQREYRFG